MPGVGQNPYMDFGQNVAPNPYPSPAAYPGQGTSKIYRPELGESLTDAEYAAKKKSAPLEALQAQTNIQTNATEDVASKAAQLGETQRQSEASLQASAERRRLAEIPNLIQTFNSSLTGGGGATPPQVNYGDAIAGEDAANSAAYGRAKDTAGQQGRAAMNALSDVMGARGLTGSGLSVNRAGGVIGAANSNLADVNREQLIQSLQANRARASEQFQGGIAQRGQDVSIRGQNLNAQQAFINPLMGLITARY